LEGALLRRVYERFLGGVGSRVELARLLSEELASFQQEEEKRTGRAEIPWPKVDEVPLTENPNAPVLKKAESYQEQARRSERLTYSP
jgi:hypothetical protein